MRLFHPSVSASINPGGAVLALDMGTTTGWAMWSPGGLVTTGTARFAPRRHEGGGMRYLRFRGWLNEVQATTRPLIGAVVYEEVRRHLGTDAAHIYGGLLAHMTAWAEAHKIPYRGVPVQAIKRAATGKGNAKKDAMIQAAKIEGFSPEDDNEADAIALLLGTLRGTV